MKAAAVLAALASLTLPSASFATVNHNAHPTVGKRAVHPTVVTRVSTASAARHCRVIHGHSAYCQARSHRHAIRVVSTQVFRHEARAHVQHWHKPRLNWNVHRLARQNHTWRVRLKHVSKLPTWAPTDPVAIGRMLAAQRGWVGSEWSCLYQLWNRESGWQMHDPNPYSGADGIPQALPPSKMGAGWATSAWVQIRWGLGYISGRYGTPCGAWSHSNAYNWY